MKTENFSRKLYNHFGVSYEMKIPEVANVLKNEIKSVQNVFERNLSRDKNQKKIHHENFLKAKYNIQNNAKRDLKSIKIEKLNQVKVLKQSLKELNNISNIFGLLKFEIKKIQRKILNNAKYLHSLYKWTKKTSDQAEQKIKKFESAKRKAFEKEKKLLLILNLLLIIQKKENNKKKKNVKFTSEEILFKQEHRSQMQLLYGKLLNELTLVNEKKDFQKKNLKKKLKQINIDYARDKKTLILKKRYDISIEEKEYTKNFDDAKKLHIKKKNDALVKLQKIKIERKLTDKNIKSKKKQIENVQKFAIFKIKLLKKLYVSLCASGEITERFSKKAKIVSLDFNSLDNQKRDLYFLIEKTIKNFQNFLENKESKNSIIKEDKFKKFKKNEKDLIKGIKKLNNLYTKEIRKEAKRNTENKIILSDHFGFLGNLEYKKIITKKHSKTYDLKFAKELLEISYEGDYIQQNAKVYIDYANNWIKELDKLNVDRMESLLNKSHLNKWKMIEEKNRFIQSRNKIKVKWKEKVIELKKDFSEKNITKVAYRRLRSEYKIYQKEEINEEKFKNNSKKTKSSLLKFKWRYWGLRQIWKKVYGSKIVENRRNIPTETINGVRWIAMILNLIVPGASEVSLFKQYHKGIIMIFISLLMYILFVPFILGINSTRFGGILGLIDMGASKHNWLQGITPDARYYLLGSIISIFLAVFLFVFNISSSITAYKTAKVMEHGARPMGWTHTRRWLSNQGFPWLISLPGWILILFIVVTPVLTSLLISFTNIGFNHEPPGRTVDWVGFEQYGKWWLFKDSGMAKSMWRIIQWTLIWTLLSSSLVIFLGSLVAVIVNQNRIKFKKIWRIIYIIPWAIPAFVTIMFMKSAFQSGESALMNMVFLKLGFIDKPVDWMGKIWTVRIILILLQGWLGHSYIFLLVLGNMQSISKDVYEASSIDGAKNNQMFRYITMPILLSSIAPLLISQFSFNFNNFTIISLFSGGGPAFKDPTPFLEGGTDILISWIYKLTTGVAQIDGNIAFSSAMTILAATISVGVASYGFAKSAAFRRF